MVLKIDNLGLDYKVADDYFKLKEDFDRIKLEMKPLRDKIKTYMDENNLDELSVDKYKIRLKIKYEATQDFINLLRNNNLEHYIVERCPTAMFNKACKELEIGVGG